MNPDTISRLSRWAAWILLIALAVITLGPIGVRPVSQAPVGIEHTLAFAALGLAFAMGYPRHLPTILALVIAVVVLLEVGQTFDPSRHARLSDIIQKMIGGGMGVAFGAFVHRWQNPPR